MRICEILEGIGDNDILPKLLRIKMGLSKTLSKFDDYVAAGKEDLAVANLQDSLIDADLDATLNDWYVNFAAKGNVKINETLKELRAIHEEAINRINNGI